MTTTESRPDRGLRPRARAGRGDRAAGAPGRRGRPRDRVAQAELRQGAVPRPVPARPDRPAGRSPAPSSRPGAEEFLGQAGGVRPHQDRRRADRAGRPHPRRGVPRPGRARRVRHEDRREVRRPRAVQPGLLPGADARRLGQPGRSARCSRRTSRSACRSRSSCSARRSRRRSSCPGWPPARCRAFLLTEPDVGSDPARLGTTAVPTPEGDYLLNGVKLWATNGTRGHAARRDGPGAEAEGHRGGITAFVVEGDARGHHRRAAQQLPRPARPGEQRDPVPRRARAGGERHRRRGPGPEDRADHAQHRPAVAAGDVRRRGQVVPRRRPRVVGRTGCSGAARSASTRRWPRRSRSSPRRRTAWSPCWTCAACSPTTTATTSASRPRWSSCTPARWPGRSPTS